MAAVVEVNATPELEAAEPALHGTLRRFVERLNALRPDQIEAVLAAAAEALSEVAETTSPAVAALNGGRRFMPEERVTAEVEVLMRAFARRRELLAGALTASQVARLLGTSRQTPHDRLRAATLLAVLDDGAWRFPAWQFDPDGDNGVVAGLPDVIRTLDVSPIARISWLIRPNPQLDGETPLACLKGGQVERVVALARAVGVD